MVIASNLFLYLGYSIAMGLAVVQLQTLTNLKVQFKKTLYYGSMSIIPLASFLPILDLSKSMSATFGLSFLEAIRMVLTTFQVGHAWIFISVLSVISISVSFFPKMKGRATIILQIILLVLIAFFISWSSHSGSSQGLSGILTHMLHFVGFAIWIGPLFVLAWLTQPIHTLEKFHKWFSPLAFSGFMLIIISGLLLMNQLVPSYVNSWTVSYGQSLLIKHLFFIPLVLFGIRHAFLLSWNLSKLSNQQYLTSFKIESVIALAIFAISAYMTEQVPPAEGDLSAELSPLYRFFQQGDILFANSITIHFSITSLIMLLLSLGLIFSLGWLLIKRNHLVLALIGSLTVIILIYIAFMTSLVSI
ncbi:putative copper export protein [Bacillus sp. TS-2]|nr:putative copper export protein [Bacillus sp. TS-2]